VSKQQQGKHDVQENEIRTRLSERKNTEDNSAWRKILLLLVSGRREGILVSSF
jgi:hypothetical protein